MLLLLLLLLLQNEMNDGELGSSSSSDSQQVHSNARHIVEIRGCELVLDGGSVIILFAEYRKHAILLVAAYVS